MMSSVMSATGSASGSGEAPAPWSPNRQPGSAPAAQPSVRGRTTVRIEASRSTEVTLSLDAPVSGPLVVEPLRAGPTAPTIGGVSVSLATDGSGDLEVRAAVPPEVRPDRYTGALFDQANRPVGRLTIAVLG
jgi:hypothetical protein